MRKNFVVLAGLVVLLLGAAPVGAAYPGGNGRIAFQRDGHVFTMTQRGADVRQLTSGTAREFRPRYSPSGRQIAYVRETAAGRRDIWLMGADGSGKRPLTTTGDIDAAPSWSPDGRSIAFSAGRRGSSPMKTLDVSSGRITGLLLHGLPAFTRGSLAWSPDGRHIAYHGGSDNPEYGPAINVLDTPTQTQVTWAQTGGLGKFGEPAWSSDGRRLAFDDGSATDVSEVRLVLTSYPGHDLRFTPLGDHQAAYAPAGRDLLLVSGGTIYRTGVAAGPRTALTLGAQPDWQPTH